MNCVIPGRGIRVFGKAIQCLAKIGEELYIEALTKGLALKTVNTARSAFASFLLCQKFFHSYSSGQRSGEEEEEEGEGEGGKVEDGEDTIKCKITIRSCLTVFRALGMLEKTVDYFTLTLDLKLSKLVFVFHCKHGIVKTHNLGFQECEALEAVFTKDLCPNQIKVQSRTLSEVVGNFPSFLEEVTMTADPESVHLKNYSEDDSVDTRSTLTEVRLMPAEFDDYQIGVDTAITFCLKELRAVLLFTDALPHSLSVWFESAGRPVVFSIDESTDFKADFVLATLSDSTATSASTTHHHHHHIASSTATTHTHTVRQKKSTSTAVQSNKVVQNGRGRRGTNGEGLPRHDRDNETVEDEWSHPFSRPARDMSRRGREGERIAPGHTALTTSSRSSQPASAGRHSNLLDGRNRHSVSHHGGVGEVMMEGVCEGERGEEEEEGRGDAGSGGGRSGSVPQVVDPLDALFGEENMMDVAEGGGWVGGDGFGMGQLGPQPVTTATHREPQSSFSVSDKPSLRSPHPPLASLSTTTTTTTTTSTPSLSPHHTYHHRPLSPVREDGWGESREGGGPTTQDSILQDSGFLPGTPPAKKFKASSLLFRVGLFTSDLSTAGQSEILAPDSEEECD